MSESMIDVTVTGDAPEVIKRTARSLKGWVTSATGDIAHEAAGFIRDRFLNGRALSRISGQTYDSVRAYFAKEEKSWYVRAGVRVPGSLNYLIKWAGTGREFIQPGFKEYLSTMNASDKIAKIVEEKMNK